MTGRQQQLRRRINGEHEQMGNAVGQTEQKLGVLGCLQKLLSRPLRLALEVSATPTPSSPMVGWSYLAGSEKDANGSRIEGFIAKSQTVKS